MKKLSLLSITAILFIATLSLSKGYAQSVGINSTGAAPNASAMLHVDVGTSTTQGLLVTGTFNGTSTVPDLGAGSRMMFYPGKSAFRAGGVLSTQWNNASVGFYSTATGYSTTASGLNSTAMGNQTTASGGNSTAMGAGTTASGSASTAMGQITTAGGYASTAMGNTTMASGSFSTAMGQGTTASGDASIAMGANTTAIGSNSTAMGLLTIASGSQSTAIGYQTTASSVNSTAMGVATTASGVNSTAMGRSTTASGEGSTAMGYNTYATGNYSTAMGVSVSTGGQPGAFSIGDSNPGGTAITTTAIPDQFVARFWNGYYFLTSDNTTRFGVQIAHNGNSWLSICDKNVKENFEPLNGEEVLQKIKAIPLSSWNYKQQDPKVYRHYGIMAQDFYNAFGKDKYGTIGNDTTVNPIDMIGIDMAAIQALEKRTTLMMAEDERQKAEGEKLKVENENLKQQIKEQAKENESLRQSVVQLQNQFDKQQKLVAQSLAQLKVLAAKTK